MAKKRAVTHSLKITVYEEGEPEIDITGMWSVSLMDRMIRKARKANLMFKRQSWREQEEARKAEETEQTNEEVEDDNTE